MKREEILTKLGWSRARDTASSRRGPKPLLWFNNSLGLFGRTAFAWSCAERHQADLIRSLKAMSRAHIGRFVTLSCPKCKREKKGPLSKYDPPQTARVEALCPNCDPNGFDDVRYYDAKGVALEP